MPNVKVVPSSNSAAFIPSFSDPEGWLRAAISARKLTTSMPYWEYSEESLDVFKTSTCHFDLLRSQKMHNTALSCHQNIRGAPQMFAIDGGIELLFTEYFYTSKAITIEKYRWPLW